MKLNPIALAIPLFLMAMGLELFLARRRHVGVYRFSDAVTDVGCGLGNQALGLVSASVLLAIYALVHRHFTLFRFPEGSAWPWVVGFVGVDVLYYWWHRASHEVNVLWASHVVHHQSEDYNLAVALRQPYFSNFTILPFYLPLALVGVPPLIYATHAALSLLYQFWIHTELVRHLPAPLEWVLNTPSHHRVHHGTNPEYLDKNYGAIFIVWDRLFGTFEPEGAPVVYGVTEPIRSFNPLWANFEFFREIARRARLRPGLLAWPRALLGRPGRDPLTGVLMEGKAVFRETAVKHEAAPATPGTQLWVLAQLVVVALGLMACLLSLEILPPWVLGAAALLIWLATLAWSGIIERRRWAWPMEGVRLALSVALVLWVVAH